MRGYVKCPECGKQNELPLSTPAGGGFFFNLDFKPFFCSCGASISSDQMLEYEATDAAPSEVSVPDIVAALDKKTGKGALFDDVLKAIEKAGRSRDEAFDLITEAFDTGKIYEPSIGWLMKV